MDSKNNVYAVNGGCVRLVNGRTFAVTTLFCTTPYSFGGLAVDSDGDVYTIVAPATVCKYTLSGGAWVQASAAPQAGGGGGVGGVGVACHTR